VVGELDDETFIHVIRKEVSKSSHNSYYSHLISISIVFAEAVGGFGFKKWRDGRER
jgi:hypothetical protein